MFDLADAARGPALEFVTMALGWDPAPGRFDPGRAVADIDLNASAFLFSDQVLFDVVFHEQLTSKDGAVRHLGDSTTGQGDGDNEVIVADLGRLSGDVTSIVYVVTSYTGQPLHVIDNAFCRMVDGVAGTEIVRVDLGHYASTGFVVGAVALGDDGWRVHPIGEDISARHPSEALAHLARLMA
ncbi:TerD family protein [Nocardia cyriacigeorgica]|uniref:Putative Stress response protein n=1 Tax=Nocardia cyriacigeorgica (strain GUH-2) TaxID=1127134 RepID=H6QZA4_NOCCG|nr:TerD family protein [Nocardia cyriacigeorgica]BDT86472.1 tellurium resistance protein TerZ [Nocardia cyriacigeorgica]CCF62858.1 Putative Stress response protein [Nocardia cyriacigeorgica GUH-2]